MFTKRRIEGAHTCAEIRFSVRMALARMRLPEPDQRLVPAQKVHAFLENHNTEDVFVEIFSDNYSRRHIHRVHFTIEFSII